MKCITIKNLENTGKTIKIADIPKNVPFTYHGATSIYVKIGNGIFYFHENGLWEATCELGLSVEGFRQVALDITVKTLKQD